MTDHTAQAILHHLQQVDAERAARRADRRLEQAVMTVKSYQHGRFARTYADLLDDPRHAGCARFFLDELYGPRDDTVRDAEFARVVPTLTRLFPGELAHTVGHLAQLHALSEGLDTAMARATLTVPSAAPSAVTDLSDASYAQAWRSVGRRADREQQIALTLQVGRSMDTYTRKPLLRTTLRLMRKPAHAAGLTALQGLLERGFDAFAGMKGAEGFLTTIEQRETALMNQLFAQPAA